MKFFALIFALGDSILKWKNIQESSFMFLMSLWQLCFYKAYFFVLPVESFMK